MDKSLSKNPIDQLGKAVLDWLDWYREMGIDALKPVKDMERVSLRPRKETSLVTLPAIREELGDCTRCKLCSGRTHIVFGSGNPKARLMFVGEGPGEEEDRQGLPFVGKAGQLLTKMIIAMGLAREEVYIANIVKCRPPNNRVPDAEEIASCQPFLLKQIQAIRPQIICALGTLAAQTLLSTKRTISALRGQFYPWQGRQGIKVLPTFHPAYLLRNPGEKKRAWEDLQKIMETLKMEQR